MDVLVRIFDRDLGRAEAPLLDLAGDQPATGDAQRANGLVELVQRHPGVHQGPQGHIAADSAGTIEIGSFHPPILAWMPCESKTPRPHLDVHGADG